MPKKIRAPEITQALPDALDIDGRTNFTLDENLAATVKAFDVPSSPWIQIYRRFRFVVGTPTPPTAGFFISTNWLAAPNTVLEINQIKMHNRTGTAFNMIAGLTDQGARPAGAYNVISTLRMTACDRPTTPLDFMQRLPSLCEVAEFSASIPAGMTVMDRWRMSAGALDQMITLDLQNAPYFIWSDNAPIALSIICQTANQNMSEVMVSGREWRVRKRVSV